MATVCSTMVPKNVIFLPYISDKRGMNSAEKVQPKKKLMPMNAIVNFVEPMKILFEE
jgi:hypothetical protein